MLDSEAIAGPSMGGWSWLHIAGPLRTIWQSTSRAERSFFDARWPKLTSDVRFSHSGNLNRSRYFMFSTPNCDVPFFQWSGYRMYFHVDNGSPNLLKPLLKSIRFTFPLPFLSLVLGSLPGGRILGFAGTSRYLINEFCFKASSEDPSTMPILRTRRKYSTV